MVRLLNSRLTVRRPLEATLGSLGRSEIDLGAIWNPPGPWGQNHGKLLVIRVIFMTF